MQSKIIVKTRGRKLLNGMILLRKFNIRLRVILTLTWTSRKMHILTRRDDREGDKGQEGEQRGGKRQTEDK